MADYFVWNGGIKQTDRDSCYNTMIDQCYIPVTKDQTMFVDGANGVMYNDNIPLKQLCNHNWYRTAQVGDRFFTLLVPPRNTLDAVSAAIVPQATRGVNPISGGPYPKVGTPTGAAVNIIAVRVTDSACATDVGTPITLATLDGLSLTTQFDANPLAVLSAPEWIAADEAILIGYEIVSLPASGTWADVDTSISVFAKTTPYFSTYNLGV